MEPGLRARPGVDGCSGGMREEPRRGGCASSWEDGVCWWVTLENRTSRLSCRSVGFKLPFERGLEASFLLGPPSEGKERQVAGVLLLRAADGLNPQAEARCAQEVSAHRDLQDHM